jgi:hypothetical protein
MRRPWRWLVAALLIPLLWFARATYAGDAESESDAHLWRGFELRQAGKNGAALAEFQSAWALVPSPKARAQIGLALQALGDWLGAESALEDAMGAPADPWVARYREALDGALATVRAHLAWLFVDADVSAGEVFLNGRSARALPSAGPIRIAAGVLEIEVRATGHAPERRTLEVVGGTDLHERFVLATLPAIPTPAGTSTANPLATSAPERRASEAIAHPRRAAMAYLALGAAGALAAGGVVAWRVREDDVAAYDDNSRCLVGDLTRAQRCGGLANASNVALGLEIGAFAAAGAAAGTGVWLLWTPSRTPASAVALGCGPLGLYRITCTGRF